MSNELEHAFGALTADADRAQLLPAAEVRRLAGVRTRRASFAAIATVAVLVAGVAVGSRWVLTGDDPRPQPLPPLYSADVSPSESRSGAASGSPSPAGTSAPPSSAPPATTPSSAAAPALPTSIPARAMLNGKDGNGDETTEADTLKPPKLCANTVYPSFSRAAVQKTVKFFYRPPGQDPTYTPRDDIFNTVTVFRGDGAADFVDELGMAVRRCPNGTRGDIPTRNRSLGSLGLGDESLLVERSSEARDDLGEPVGDGSRSYAYVAVVRIGDTVTRVESFGYESASSERRTVEELVRKAADRLAGWRR